MRDPYGAYFDKFTSASRPFAIVPSDDNKLERVCKALRVYNPTNAAITVKVETSGGDTLTLDYPANALVVEPVIIVRVFANGTSAGVKLHGYSD